MADLLLTLIAPDDVAQDIEDLLLARPDLIRGFTTHAADGHGSLVRLVEAAELVAGHTPRTMFQTAGDEAKMRAAMATVKEALPRANIYYWLTPVIAMGRL
jgi:hypothetical protein